MCQNFDFWLKFRLLTKISIIYQKIDICPKFDIWPKFRYLTKILIFDQNLDSWLKFRYLTKFWIVDQIFDIWPTFRYLTNISIFDQNFDILPKFRYFTKISIFHQHFYFLKTSMLGQDFDFDQYFDFWLKCLYQNFGTNFCTVEFSPSKSQTFSSLFGATWKRTAAAGQLFKGAWMDLTRLSENGLRIRTANSGFIFPITKPIPFFRKKK